MALIPSPVGLVVATHPFSQSGGGPLVVTSFDTFASVPGGSHNSGLNIQSTDGSVSLGWFYAVNQPGGAAYVFYGSGDSFDLLAPTIDQLNQLAIVFDTDSLEFWGTYDLGGGVTGETPHFSASLPELQSLEVVRILQDFRGIAGVEIDNILITQIPEPGLPLLLASPKCSRCQVVCSSTPVSVVR
ncbi:MAG: hypothetical protein ABGZ49_02390 [Akkermansiaceae bacterium]